MQPSQRLSLEQQIEQVILSKKIAENELYRILAKQRKANLNDQEAIAAADLREKIDALDARLNELLEQQQKQQNAGYFGWFKRK
jgi:hypothetical protein